MSSSPIPTKEIPIEDPYAYCENISRKQFQKLLFISNALDNGWTVKKQEHQYIFTKKGPYLIISLNLLRVSKSVFLGIKRLEWRRLE